ncbi:AAA family ATPase [Flavobacterium artemisiae]|uniref:AAA family ATPase n=1 Tax=Flavobacterium artemisiae TaxID=2126556 RepID=A0ABW4HHN9_9FLAO
MELKFVWIQEYKNIKNTGFNLNNSSQEEFQFINNELTISKSIKTPENFFKENISGVTAIVGKNGSGKTNLTEFINYNLAHATNGSLETHIKSEGLLIIDHWIFVQKEIEIINEENLIEAGYKILRYEYAPLDQGQQGLRWYEMENNKYIYYNPTFDLRGVSVQNNLVNISTTALVYNDLYNLKYVYPINNNSEITQLDAFQDMENSRICDFILNFELITKYIHFLPREIKIYLLNNDFFNKQNFYGDDLNDPKKKSLDGLQDELDNLLKNLITDDFEAYFTTQRENSSVKYYNLPIEEQKAFFFRLFFINVFQTLINKEILFPKNYFVDALYEEVLKDSIENLDIHKSILTLKKNITEIINNANWNNYELPLPDTYDSKRINIYEYLGSLALPITENTVILNETILLMDELFDNRRIFTYEPHGQFSSGEKHLLTLYSRFFWARKQIKNSETRTHGIKGESIVIFIDEGEVALHPEWQRVFFDKIITFLSELFKDKKIQLILTTHSPFVLSDIPQNNVLFLDKDENNNTKISNIEKEQTFGANIHELLADSFFLNEGFMGEFAKSKILDLINYLTFDDQIAEKENNIKPTGNWSEQSALEVINIIGEQVIKDRLLNLFDKKFTSKSKESILSRMEELKKELEKFDE